MAENPDSRKKPARKQGEFELATPTIAKQPSRPKAKPPAVMRSGTAQAGIPSPASGSRPPASALKPAPPEAGPQEAAPAPAKPAAQKPAQLPAQAPAPKASEQKAAPAPTTPQPKTAQPPAPKPPDKEEDEFIENMKVPLLGWWDFVRANFKQYYIELLKLGLMKLVVSVGAFIIMLLLALALVFGTASLGGGIVGIILMAAVILAGYFVIFWVNNAFEAAAYTMTDAMLSGRKYSMAETLISQKGRTLSYTVADAAFRILMLVPAAAVIAVLYVALGPGAGGASLMVGLMAAYLFFIVYLMLAGALYEFLTQFWRYGFAVENRGIIDSLKGGLSLVRRNPLEVIVFDFILLVMILLASIPMMVFYFAAYIVLMVVMFIPVLGIFLYFAGFLLVYLVAILLLALVEVAWRPAHCLFWKRMKAL
ncbi:MAG: hypothetical protein AB1529_01445 [Candidatus Micrarchaeota archaeon]